MIDYTALKSEIDNDPASMGYSAFVESGNDQGIADLLNAPNAGTVARTRIDNSTFVSTFLPHLVNIAALSDQGKKELYWRVWEAILAMPTITFGNSNVAGMMAMAVVDGILTASQAAAFQQRQGSRAEVLFGADTTITNTDVSFALRGVR